MARGVGGGEDAYARATNSNDSIYQDLALAFCAHASAELGEMERARALLERARAGLEANGGRRFFADWMIAMVAETLFNLGDMQGARKISDELIAAAPTLGGIYAEGSARPR